MDILPTHRCFDDAFEFLEDLGEQHLRAHHHEYTVVHAECVAGDGRAFAHAWVEHIDPVLLHVTVWQAGIIRGHRVFYGTRREFPFEVRRQWRYSLKELVRLNYSTGGSRGPWAPELDALCGDSGEIMVRVDATASEEARAALRGKRG